MSYATYTHIFSRNTPCQEWRRFGRVVALIPSLLLTIYLDAGCRCIAYCGMCTLEYVELEIKVNKAAQDMTANLQLFRIGIESFISILFWYNIQISSMYTYTSIHCWIIDKFDARSEMHFCDDMFPGFNSYISLGKEFILLHHHYHHL